MDDEQEREIALGLRAGKPESWHALYDEFGPSIWQTVARSLGPRHAEIADIVQETFMAAAQGARLYDGSRGSLKMWLGGIARNKIALYFRKQKPHDRASADPGRAATVAGLLPWLENREADPGAALQAAELATQVRAALTVLPHDYETLLVAKYIDGQSVQQLAAAEQSTSEAVRSKLARARRAFRELFVKTSAHPLGNEERVQ